MKATRGILWTLDFDGTLSHLVPDRSAAVLEPECAECLQELAADSENVVAVVSSRTLEDLETRVRVENVLLSGSCGLEWRLPGGSRLHPGPRTEERVEREREKLMSLLEPIRPVAGVDIEDKRWSVAVHIRETAEDELKFVLQELEHLRIYHGLTLFYGPAVAEIQLLEEVSKLTAERALVRLLERQFPNPTLVYAGDDQNDVQAMRWVLERKGIVFAVGEQISVKGACAVGDPTALAFTLRRRFMPTLET